MINLAGKTQVEIEKMFSNDSVIETLQLNTEMFYSQVNDEDLDSIRKLFKIDDIDDFMLYFIALIGNPEMGKRMYAGHRVIEAEPLAKAIGSSRFLEELFPLPTERYPIALEVVALFDTIFFDIEIVKELIQDNQWTTNTQCRIEFDIDVSTAEIAELTMFKFPLIEQPIDWEEGYSGGYHLSTSKSTLNRGEAKQPQNCLDILNTLQHQKFCLTDNVSAKHLQDYIYTKLLKKYNEDLATDITKYTTITADLVFNTMKQKEFMFEWRFDFRGRLYSTGYDINLQSDKYRKGVIKPCIENFKEKL